MSDLGSASLKAAADSIHADVTQLEALRAPASDEEILKTLQKLAEMFQVSVPEPDGLELYIAALKPVPRIAFVKARETLTRTHKWPRLPYPAEFIEAAEPTTKSLQAAIRSLIHHRDRCIFALEKLHTRSNNR